MKKSPSASFMLLFLILVTLKADGQEPQGDLYLSKQEVLLFSLLTYLPLQAVDTYHKLQYIPGPIRFPLKSLPALGFFATGEYGKAALFGGIPIAAGGITLWNEGIWPQEDMAYITNNHIAYLTEYEVYKSLRLRVSPEASFQYNWQPVDTGDILLSPLRLDYLADPFVSGFLGALVIGRLLIYGRFIAPNKSSPQQPNDYIKIENEIFPRPLGTALFGIEGVYSSWWAGIAEEAFFRGFLFPEISEHTNIWIGAITSSLIFSLGHWTNKRSLTDNLVAFFTTFMPISLYMSYLSVKEDFDFRKAAFAHTWYNSFITIFDVIFGTFGSSPSLDEIKQAGFTLNLTISY